MSKGKWKSKGKPDVAQASKGAVKVPVKAAPAPPSMTETKLPIQSAPAPVKTVPDQSTGQAPHRYFCGGCKAQIQESAPNCPGCGAGMDWPNAKTVE